MSTTRGEVKAMNCTESLGLLSEFYENSLDEGATTQVRTHLTRCGECAGIYEELTVIVRASHELRSEETIVFPDENLIWQRISRTAH